MLLVGLKCCPSPRGCIPGPLNWGRSGVGNIRAEGTLYAAGDWFVATVKSFLQARSREALVLERRGFPEADYGRSGPDCSTDWTAAQSVHT